MAREIFWGLFILVNVGMIHLTYLDIRSKLTRAQK